MYAGLERLDGAGARHARRIAACAGLSFPPATQDAMIGVMKLLLKIGAVLVLLLVLGAVVLVFAIDPIAAEMIRRGGTYALGVETTVDEVDLGLGAEIQAELSGLAVANPEGFESERFLKLGAGSLRFPRGDLFADVITVPELKLDSIEINLERRGGKNNYDVILANLEKLGSGDGGEKPDDGGGKRFAIERILLTNVDATIDLLPLAGDATRIDIHVPQIVIEDIASDMTTAQLFDLVIRTLLTAVLENGAGLLPDDMLQDLQSRLKALGSVAFDVSGGAVRTSKQILSAAEEILNEGTEELGKQAGEAIKDLGGILKEKD
jgi:hypothetical protein